MRQKGKPRKARVQPLDILADVAAEHLAEEEDLAAQHPEEVNLEASDDAPGPSSPSSEAMQANSGSHESHAYICCECNCPTDEEPTGISPLYPNETRQSTSCDRCTFYFHHMCLPLSARMLLRDAQSSPGSKPNVHCYKCSSLLSYDIYNLNNTDELFAGNMSRGLQKTGHAAHEALKQNSSLKQGGFLKAVSASLSGCSTDVQTKMTPRIALAAGPSNVGKSALLDNTCRLWPDGCYTPIPSNWVSVLKTRICHKLQLHDDLQEWDVTAAFTDQGLLTVESESLLHDILTSDEQATASLARCFMEGLRPEASQLPPAVLMTMREDQLEMVTTSQAVMIIKDERHGMLVLLMDDDMLWKVVDAMRRKELQAAEQAFMKAVFGCESTEDLPQSPQQVAAMVTPELQGCLGTQRLVKLPGKEKRHERLYMLYLLQQLGGQLNEREPWMWLAWLVVRSVPSALLPGCDIVMDMPGKDANVVHGIIRQESLALADGIVLVSRGDFHIEMKDTLEELETSGLLAKVADGKLSMMVVNSDHGQYGVASLRNEKKWEGIETKFRTKEDDVRKAIEGQLQKLRTEGQEGAVAAAEQKLPIVTMRPLLLAGLMAALSNGSLAAEPQELSKFLVQTGSSRFFTSLMRILKADSLNAVEAVAGRVRTVQALMLAMTGECAPKNEHAQIIPSDRLGGTGPLSNDAATLKRAKKVLEKLQPKVTAWLQSYTGKRAYDNHVKYLEEAVQGLTNTLDNEDVRSWVYSIKLLWMEKGRSAAEKAVRTAAHGQLLGEPLLAVQVLIASITASQMKRRGKAGVGSSQLKVPPLLLNSLLLWPTQLTLEQLQPLLRPLQSMPRNMVRDMTKELPEFQVTGTQLGAEDAEVRRMLQRLKYVWEDHIIPLVMDSELLGTGLKQKMLKELQTGLMGVMVDVVSGLLGQLQKDMATMENQPDLAELLEAHVIGKVWSETTKAKLLRAAVEALYCGVVEPAMKKLTNNRAFILVRGMQADLDVLVNSDLLQQVQYEALNIAEPAEDMQEELRRQFQQGSCKLEQLIVLMHQNKDLLVKYSDIQCILYDTCLDNSTYEEFRKRQSNSNVIDWPRLAKTPFAEHEQNAIMYLSTPSMEVDVQHLTRQLASSVMGVRGQVLQNGHVSQLSPADDQQAVLQELLKWHLLRHAVEETHGSREAHITWFKDATGGQTYNEVLTSSSHEAKPLHLLALLALVLRRPILVRLPADATSLEDGDAGSPAGTKRRGSRKRGKKGASSLDDAEQPVPKKSRGGTGRVPSAAAPKSIRPVIYVFFKPPKKANQRCVKTRRQGAPDAASNAAASSSSAAAPAAPAAESEQEVECGLKLLQLVLKKEQQRWRFDVVSCSLTKEGSARTVVALDDDDQYGFCAQCLEGGGVVACCDGLHCLVSVGNDDDHPCTLGRARPPPNDPLNRTPWLCNACLMRGRTITDPAHLKPKAAAELLAFQAAS